LDVEHQRLVGARLLGLQAGDDAVELRVGVVFPVLRHRQPAHLRDGREPGPFSSSSPAGFECSMVITTVGPDRDYVEH